MEMGLDLETYSLRAGGIIRSIGIVIFDRAELPGVFHDERIIIVREDSCKRIGMHKCPQTVQWWKDQSQEARDHLLGDYAYQTPIRVALHSLTQLYKQYKCTALWSHGILSDGAWIEEAYHLAGIKSPIHFREHRDTRTIFDLGDIKNSDWDYAKSKIEGPAHNPLVDVKRTSALVQLAYGRIKK